MYIVPKKFDGKAERYDYIGQQLKLILGETQEWCSALANASALLMLMMPGLNWAGFYLEKGGELVLGPFQGKPAVARIAMGAGVCGTALQKRCAQVIENVHTCDNHIACDLSSAAEIVVPILSGGEIIGVIDIDSPHVGHFDGEDLHGLEAVAAALGAFYGRVNR